MLTPISYAVPLNGLLVGAPSSYYWWGIGGAAGTKFRANGTAVPEAGFLSAMSTVLFGSNLPLREIGKYSHVTQTNRYSGQTASSVFVGIWGKNRAVFPIFASWQVFGPPANAG